METPCKFIIAKLSNRKLGSSSLISANNRTKIDVKDVVQVKDITRLLYLASSYLVSAYNVILLCMFFYIKLNCLLLR